MAGSRSSSRTAPSRRKPRDDEPEGSSESFALPATARIAALQGSAARVPGGVRLFHPCLPRACPLSFGRGTTKNRRRRRGGRRKKGAPDGRWLGGRSWPGAPLECRASWARRRWGGGGTLQSVAVAGASDNRVRATRVATNGEIQRAGFCYRPSYKRSASIWSSPRLRIAWAALSTSYSTRRSSIARRSKSTIA